MALIDGEYYYRPPAKKTVAKKAVYYPKAKQTYKAPPANSTAYYNAPAPKPVVRKPASWMAPPPPNYVPVQAPSWVPAGDRPYLTDAQLPMVDQSKIAPTRPEDVMRPYTLPNGQVKMYTQQGYLDATRQYNTRPPATPIPSNPVTRYGLPNGQTFSGTYQQYMAELARVAPGYKIPATPATGTPAASPAYINRYAPISQREEAENRYYKNNPPNTNHNFSFANPYDERLFERLAGKNLPELVQNMPTNKPTAFSYGDWTQQSYMNDLKQRGAIYTGSSPVASPWISAVGDWLNNTFSSNQPNVTRLPGTPSTSRTSATTTPWVSGYNQQQYNVTRMPGTPATNAIQAKTPYQLPQWKPEWWGEQDPRENDLYGSPYQRRATFTTPATRSLSELLGTGADPWAHDPYDPAGTPYRMEGDGSGLYSGDNAGGGGGGGGGYGDWGGWGGGGGGGGGYGASSGVNSYLPGAGGGYGARASAPNYTGRGAGRGSSYAGSESYNTSQWRMPMLVWNI